VMRRERAELYLSVLAAYRLVGRKGTLLFAITLSCSVRAPCTIS
jgi:hypothetical protein